jgi:VWFA-related protein
MKKLLIVVIVVLCVVAIVGGQQPYTVSVDVDVVFMNVRVTGRDGEAIRGLNAENFNIFEDRKLQDISFFSGEDSAATIGLVIDASNSMLPKWNNVRDAVTAFAHTSNPQDEMFIVQFNEKLFWPMRNKDFTNDAADLERAMNGLVPSGTTALYDAIESALEHSKRGKYEKKVFDVVSDGEDNSSEQSLDPLLLELQKANVTLYTVGLYERGATDKNPKVLRQLAAATGGEAFFPKDRQQTQDALQFIANRIRHQYTLGFYPKGPADGRFHNLSVRVESQRRGLSVRTRPGYVAREKR